MSCHLQAGGTIELYFYGELPLAERAEVQAHMGQCAECRAALDDLSVIRAALAVRPDVATPPGGDWSGFMARLNTRIADEGSRAGRGHTRGGESRRDLVAPPRRAVSCGRRRARARHHFCGRDAEAARRAVAGSFGRPCDARGSGHGPGGAGRTSHRPDRGCRQSRS